MTATLDLDHLTLAHGAHDSRAEGVCLLEAVAWFAGEPHSDRPTCVSPVLAAFGRTWNDRLDDAERQRLVPLIPRLVGTAGDADADAVCGWMAVDWLVRTYAPAFLRLPPALADHADRLAALAPITSSADAVAAQPAIDAARAAGTAAWDAARAASAAWAATRAAAGDAGDAARAASAAWAATRAAAGDAGDAAWAAARAARAPGVPAAWAAGDAARDAARAASAAWAAAWAAARAAAGDAAGDAAWDAAWAAAGAALAPTVAALHESAHALFARMIAVAPPHPDAPPGGGAVRDGPSPPPSGSPLPSRGARRSVPAPDPPDSETERSLR